MLAAHSASPPAQQQDNSRDHSSGSGPQQQPLVTEPDQVIRGGPSIRSYTIQVIAFNLVTITELFVFAMSRTTSDTS